MGDADQTIAQRQHEVQARAVAELASIEAGGAAGEADALTRVTESLGDDRKLVRRAAARALVALLESGRAGAGEVAALLGHRDAHTRWGAAYAMRKAGCDDDRIVHIALEVLGNEDGDLRWAASAILAPQVRDDATLRRRLRDSACAADPVRRKMALLCLSDGGTEDAAFFGAALGDDDSYVRLAAITALGRLGARDPSSLAALAALAGADSEPAVRRAAAAVLAKLEGRATERR